MFAEVRLRTGADLSNITILRSVSGLSFDAKSSDVGVINFSYPLAEAQALGLDANSVIEVLPNGASVSNLWFGIDNSQGSRTVDGATLIAFSGKSLVNWLTDAVVYPSTWHYAVTPADYSVSTNGSRTQIVPRFYFVVGSGAVTFTSNNVITPSAHNLSVGDIVQFAAVSNNLVVNRSYYVRTVPNTTTFTLQATPTNQTIVSFTNGTGTGLTKTTTSGDATQSTVNGHAFQNAMPGHILNNVVDGLIPRAKERGGLVWLDASSFTATTDSNGNAWTTNLTATYSTGTSLLAVLQDLAARQLIDFRMDGRSLKVYNYGTSVTYFTPDQILFRRGKQITEQTRTLDASNAASAVLIQGDALAIGEVSDSTSVAALGRRREAFVSQGGITDIPTLVTLMGGAQLNIVGHIKTEDTLGVSDNDILPWQNFQPGDWVWADFDGTLKNIQVQQITASVQDAGNLQLGLTLGDLISTSDERNQKLLDNITGGNGNSLGALPNQVTGRSPASPSGVTATPFAYRDSNGIDVVQVTLNFTPPVVDTTGASLGNLDRTEVQYKIGSTAAWSNAAAIPASATPQAAFISNLPVGVMFYAQVRAVTTEGYASNWTAITPIASLPKVTTIPATPSTPTITASLQALRINWDGNNSVGGAYGAEWGHTDLFVSTVSGFTPSDSTKLGSFSTKPSTFNLSGLTNTNTYYAKLITYDKSGNASLASAQSPGVAPSQVAGSDLAPNSVTTTQIQDNAITTAKVADAAIAAAKVNFTARTIGGITTFTQSTTPTGAVANDLWIDTGNGNLTKTYNGTAWVSLAAGDGAISGISGTKIASGTVPATAVNFTARTIGGTTTFTSATTPTGAVSGDTWIDTANGNVIKQYNGTTWNAYNLATGQLSGTISVAQAGFTARQIGSNTTFTQSTTPVGALSGDSWIDTANGNVTKTYNGTTWTTLQTGDAAISGISGAKVASGTLPSTAVNFTARNIGGTTTFTQGTTPAGAVTNDLWIDTANGNVTKTYNGTAWVTLQVADAAISGVSGTKIASGTIAAAAVNFTARTIGSTTTFTQSTTPTGALTGDLWIDSGNGNVIKTYNGTTWVVNNLSTANLSGTISSAQAGFTARNIGGTTTFVAATTPAGAVSGDTWIDTANGNVLKTYNGTTWSANPLGDAAITGLSGTKLATGTVPSTAVNFTARTIGGTTTFTQSTTPVGALAGDTWIDTANGNVIKQYNGTTWTAYNLATSTLSGTISAAQAGFTARSIGGTTTFVQSTTPASPVSGDTWIDSGNGNLVKVYNGTIWVSNPLATVNLSGTITSAQAGFTARAIGSTTTFTQSTTPTGALAGDLWIDTGNGNVIKTYSGSAWVTNNLSTAQLSGTISAAQAGFTARSIGGTTTFVTGTTPTGAVSGDTWIDTANGNVLKTYNGTTWSANPLGDAAISGLSGTKIAAGTVPSTAVNFTARTIGGTTTFTQGTTPAGALSGDTWIDTANGNVIKQYNGTTWTAYNLSTAQLSGTITAAQAGFTARNIGGTTTFVSATTPTGAVSGDTWIDSANGNVLKTYNGTVWSSNPIATSTLTGTISSAQAGFTARSIGGTTTFTSATTPSGAVSGDTWIDTANGNVIKQYNGTTWVAYNLATTTLTGTITAAQAGFTARQIGAVTTFTQSTTPTGAVANDLWIDTGNGNLIKTYSGSAWVSLQDTAIAAAATAASNANTAAGTAQTAANNAQTTATNANTAAGNAQTTANNAATAASAAQTTANGRNRIFRQGTTPTGAVSGDTWFDTANGNRVSIYDGTTWNVSQLQGVAVGNLDAGSITTGSLASGRIAAGTITGTQIAGTTITAGNLVANTITAAQIAANTITAGQIAANTITAGQIAANTITAGQIAANTITAGQIAATTITAAQIATGTITASQIAAGTITGDRLLANTITATQIAANAITATQIAANTITAGQVAAGTLTATQIQAGSITGDRLVANTVTATQIAANTITATQIAAGTIVAGNIQSGTITGTQIAGTTITAANIVGGTITATQIATGTITATQIAAGAVTANKLNITMGGGNILTNSSFGSGTAGYSGNGSATTIATDLTTYYYNTPTPGSLKVTSTGTANAGLVRNFATLAPNTVYTFSAWVLNTAANGFTAPILSVQGSGVVATANSPAYTQAATWQRQSVTFTTSATPAAVVLYVIQGAAQTAGKFFNVDALQLEQGDIVTAYAPKTDEILPGTIVANMIVGNTITAAQIATGTITATQIAANTITASQIAANTITTTQIAAGTIVAGNIQSGTITGTQIAGTTITAANIVGGTITATQIASGTITAAQIQAGSITGDRLTANTITATQIAANTITTNQIAAGTIVAANIQSGTITGTQIAGTTITAANLVAGTITASQIATGTITAVQLAANSVTAEELTLGVKGQGLAQNPSFEDAASAGVGVPAGWTCAVTGAGSSATRVVDAVRSTHGTSYVKLTPGAAGAGFSAYVYSDLIAVTAGTTYYLTALYGADGASTNGLYFRANWIQSNGTTAAGTSDIVSNGAIAASTVNDQSKSGQVTAPASAGFVRLYAYNNLPATPVNLFVDYMDIQPVAINGWLAAGSITANEIAATTITAGKIAANTITAGQIAAGTITTTQIAAGTIVAGNIQSGTITGTQIAGTTITAGNIVSGTITGTQIAGTTITAANIVGGTITATQIATGTITATQILAGSITGDRLTANTITATQIAANTITASQIAANTITAGQIAAGTITASQIQSGSITADRLNVVVGGGNRMVNSYNGITTGMSVNVGGSFATDATRGYYTGSSVKFTTAATASNGIIKTVTNLLPNTKYVGSSWVFIPTTGGPANVTILANGAGVASNVSGVTTATGAWTRIVCTFTTNATATPVNLVTFVNATATAGQTFNVDGWQLEQGDVATAFSPKADETLPGTITGTMIAGTTITAGNIVSGTITGTQIAGTTITAGNLVANTITAGQIAAGTITATQIATGAITANKLNVTIGGGNLVTNSNFLNGLTGYAAWVGTISLDNTNRYYPTGSQSAKALSAGSGAGIYASVSGLQANTVYTFSAWVYIPSTNGIPNVQLTTTGQAGAQPFSTAVTTVGVWTRLGLTFTTDSVGSPVGIYALCTANSTGKSFNTDAWQLEVGDLVTSYAPKVDEILPGTVVANMIAANTITANQIATGAITATQIAAGTITANKLAAGTITANELNVTALPTSVVVNSDFESALTNPVDASMPIGFYKNAYATDPTGSVAISTGYVPYGKSLALNVVDANSLPSFGCDRVPVTAGDVWTFTFSAVSTFGSYSNYVRATTYDATGTPININFSTDGGAGENLFIGSEAVYTFTFTIPAGVAYISPWILVYAPYAPTPRTTFVNNFRVYMSSGTFISPGSITTGKIAAGAITAGQIAANTIIAGNIQAGAITANEIQANTITGNKIAAGAISTNNLTVSSFGASQAPNGSFEELTTFPAVDTAGAAGWRVLQYPGSVSTATAAVDTGGTTNSTGKNIMKLTLPTGNQHAGFIATSTPVPTVQGEIWYVSLRIRGDSLLAPSGVNVIASLGSTVAESQTMTHTANGTNVLAQTVDVMNGMPAGTTALTGIINDYNYWELAVTVPNNPSGAQYKYLTLCIGEGLANHSTHSINFDAVTLQKVGGSATITNLTASKLTAGTLNADVVLGARLKTADTGARVEINNAGLQAYDGVSSDPTVNIAASNGSMTLTGNFTAGSVTASIGESQVINSTIQGSDVILDNNGGQVFIYTPTGQTVQTITTAGVGGAGTWTAPVSATYPAGTPYTIKVECWGAGGGGCGGASLASYGGFGGAGGEYAREDQITVISGNTYSFTLGTGGAGGAAGNSSGGYGTSTVFTGSSQSVIAHGGGGAIGSYKVAGASGSTNSIHFSGGANNVSGVSYQAGAGGGSGAGISRSGSTGGSAVSNAIGGAGGAAPSGGGAGGAGGTSTAVGGVGIAPGGGGGGGGGASGGRAGGAGARGQIRITYGGTQALTASLSGIAGTDPNGIAFPAGLHMTADGAQYDASGSWLATALTGTVTASNFRKVGQVVSYYVVGTLPAITVGVTGNITNVNLFTINNTAWRPIITAPGVSGATGSIAGFTIGSNGICTLNAFGPGQGNIPAGTAYSVAGSFVVS